MTNASSALHAQPKTPDYVPLLNPALMLAPGKLFELLEHSFHCTFTGALLEYLRHKHPLVHAQLLCWHFKFTPVHLPYGPEGAQRKFQIVDGDANIEAVVPATDSDDESFLLAVVYLNLRQRLSQEIADQRFYSTASLAITAGVAGKGTTSREDAKVHLLTDLIREDEVLLAGAILCNDQALLKDMVYRAAEPEQPAFRPSLFLRLQCFLDRIRLSLTRTPRAEFSTLEP